MLKTGTRTNPHASPLYMKLKDYVRSRVESGEWKVGHRVPSENELVNILGVSRMTANRALRELADEGLVVRLRGKGSFVTNEETDIAVPERAQHR